VRGRLTDEDLRRMENAFSDRAFEDVSYKGARVYSQTRGEHVDPDRRSAEVHTGRAEGVFAAVRATLLPLLREVKPGSWTVLSNHYDLLRYGEGDFFRKHVDFTPTLTAYSTHFVVLLCLRGRCAGGETRVWLSEEESVLSTATVTKGDFLVFRGDLPHEGEPVLGGQKVVARFDLLFSPSLSSDLPFFRARQRFVSMGGMASDDVSAGLSSEETELLERYASGKIISSQNTQELRTLLDYVGCPEARALGADSFDRFARDGFVVETDSNARNAFWEAGLRKGMCALLVVMGSRYQEMEGESHGHRSVTGVAACFRDGTPAFLSGFQRCRRRLGCGGTETLLELPLSARGKARAEIFGPGIFEPRSMARDMVLWVAATEMQRDPEDIACCLGPCMQDGDDDSEAGNKASVPLDAAAEDDYAVWMEAVRPLLSRILQAAEMRAPRSTDGLVKTVLSRSPNQKGCWNPAIAMVRTQTTPSCTRR
jgi:2OG-Fe(II) oxygenase superfamily